MVASDSFFLTRDFVDTVVQWRTELLSVGGTSKELSLLWDTRQRYCTIFHLKEPWSAGKWPYLTCCPHDRSAANLHLEWKCSRITPYQYPQFSSLSTKMEMREYLGRSAVQRSRGSGAELWVRGRPLTRMLFTWMISNLNTPSRRRSLTLPICIQQCCTVWTLMIQIWTWWPPSL